MRQKTTTTEHTQQKRCRRKTLWLLLILLILLPLCVVATYTWFSISRTPKVSDMEMTINSNVGLQIAWASDAPDEEWLQHLSFADLGLEELTLTPVTWLDQEGAFYTTEYGYDGRTYNLDRRLSDEEDANRSDGHYVTFSFYGRTDEHMDISLAPAGADEYGRQLTGTYLAGVPKWDAASGKHVDTGYGAQNAIRMGLRITKFDPEDGTEGESTFYIYEPNADIHESGLRGYIATPSAEGTDHLTAEDRLIVQTGNVWYERNPAVQDDVRWQMGEFEGDTFLFDLEDDEMVRFDVYLWLENMDTDCSNTVTLGAQIMACLHFLAESHIDSGLVPIE